MKKILVTPRSLSAKGHPALNRLSQAGFEVLLPFPGRKPTEEELMEVLPVCTGYLAGVEKISARAPTSSACTARFRKTGSPSLIGEG